MTSAEKRSVATDALETLGLCPIPDDSGRDAIHLAVEPVVAAEKMLPGDHVGLLGDGRASRRASKFLGIVDPFIRDAVQEGQRFWLVVYPRQITSLRHVWEHPDFVGGEETSAVHSEAGKKAASERWLHDFIDRSDCPDYHTVIGAALRGGSGWGDDEYLHFNGRDAHGAIPDEFWDHVEVVTGKRPPHRAKYFSCSC